MPNHKKYLYRRFHKITTKPSGDNTPTPPTHTVINLSDTALSDPRVKLLSRGLKFCPAPTEHNQLSLQQNVAHFNRRLRLRELFHIEPSTDDETPNNSPSGAPSHNRFKQSVWVPPKNRDAALDNYINAVNSGFTGNLLLDAPATSPVLNGTPSVNSDKLRTLSSNGLTKGLPLCGHEQRWLHSRGP